MIADSLSRHLRATLDAADVAGRRRVRRTITVPTPAVSTRIRVDGRPCTAFCSNDYLGLSGDPRVAETFAHAAMRHGVGSGASHLVSGHGPEHAALEEALADFLGRERAILFSTGYMANLGIASALVGHGDLVVEDRLNHASLIDAGLVARAKFHRYAHADAAAADAVFVKYSGRHRLLATDGVFSMDGDVAPLGELAAVCRGRDAWLVIDDAHGFGVLGAQGRGTVEECGLDCSQAPILMGTLGKALGTFGAFVSGSHDLIEVLVQRARTYIYTTALPPAVAAAGRRALELVRAEPWRRTHLHDLIGRFRTGAATLGLSLLPSATPIQPLVLGTERRAVEASRHLLDAGFFVPAIRPPTVPPGSSRLRITLSAAHSAEDVGRLLECLADWQRTPAGRATCA
jgi:8-amino-7-oxononanoate synthase